MDNGRPWSVLLWNDEVNTIDHVVTCLVRICQHQPPSALKLTLTIHNEGKAIVKTCAFELAEAIREMLEAEGLTATMEET
jgi:ATP-dependent Clp protease adaptor protein ClpS